MDRKNLATTITLILCALTFIVIGSCFSTFIYKKEVIKVDDPKLILSQDMAAFTSDGKAIDKLELSTLTLGLKGATGDEDAETNIPSTVTDKKGSEGQYSKFKLLAPNGAKIYITNIKIENEKESAETIKEERENIMVAIKELKDSTKSLEEDKVLLGSLEPNEERMEYTFLIWLGSKVGEELESSTISFDIAFEPMN